MQGRHVGGLKAAAAKEGQDALFGERVPVGAVHMAVVQGVSYAGDSSAANRMCRMRCACGLHGGWRQSGAVPMPAVSLAMTSMCDTKVACAALSTTWSGRAVANSAPRIRAKQGGHAHS